MRGQKNSDGANMPDVYPRQKGGRILLNVAAYTVIHSSVMYTSPHILGRTSRLVLLLLLLAAQGFVTAHELDSGHTLDSHACSACVVGHGLGAAITAQPDVPQFQVVQTSVPSHSISNVRSSHKSYYLSRAPPQALC